MYGNIFCLTQLTIRVLFTLPNAGLYCSILRFYLAISSYNYYRFIFNFFLECTKGCSKETHGKIYLNKYTNICILFNFIKK